MKIIFLTLLLSTSFFSITAHAKPKAFHNNVVACPQHISGVFTMYGSNDVVQNGLKWNYGPYNQNTPAVAQLKNANTNNQISDMTPGLIMGPAIICAGKINGQRFVFMTDPLPSDNGDPSNFHAYPIGTTEWTFTD